MKKIKSLFKTAAMRQGTYRVALTVMVVAVVIIINLMAGLIPEGYRNLDVSSTNIYEISDTSKKLLASLDKKVTFTVLAVKEETDDRIKTFLSKYAALSDNIEVEWIDPVLHPSALTEYNTQENTMVVECQDTGKSKTVAFTDIIVTDMYSYYYTGTASESEFDGEGQLTSAVNYVTNDETKKIYTATGHGESSLSGTITDLMEKNNYTTEEYNLLMNPTVPEDCDLLLFYAPSTDLSEEEKEGIDSYLSDGGKVLLILGDVVADDLPRFASVMQEYGIEGTQGYIADPQRCYQGNYYYIFPELSLDTDMAEGISSEMVLLINAHGLNLVDPERETISVSAFMSTSDGAYDVTETAQKQGAYVLGAVATENVSSDGEEDTKASRLTVISAASMIDSQITDVFSQLDNTTLFMNAVASNFEGVTNLSIEPKSLAVEYNTVQYGGWFSLLVIFGIPLVILIGGFVIWLRRRKA